jgi:hypothetical protein
VVAGPAAEPHGGGEVQWPADPTARDTGRPPGVMAEDRVEPASLTERTAVSTLAGAASRRAQSTKAGQPGNEADMQ